jgi:hypothetical protein
LGGGLGHVGLIESICNRPEFSFTDLRFILKDTSKSKYIAKANKKNVNAAPAHMHSDAQYSSPYFAHIMLRCGWKNNDSEYDLVLSWVQILESAVCICGVRDAVISNRERPFMAQAV